MTRLGAENYRTVFVLAGKEINGAKALAWGYKEQTSAAEMMRKLNNEEMIGYLEQIRLVSTFHV